MTVLNAFAQTDLDSINFNFWYQEPANDDLLVQGTDYTPAQLPFGYSYFLYNGINSLNLKGEDFEFDGEDYVSRGTIKGVTQYGYYNSEWTPRWHWEGWDLSMRTFWEAGQTSTYADDEAVVAYVLREDDQVYLSDQDDSFRGFRGDDLMYGREGNDTLKGNNGDDSLHGESGDDRLYGNNGADLITGGRGADRLDGGNEKDTVSGGNGQDSLYGQAGDDTLNGNRGNDWISGGRDDDMIDGGANNDRLIGANGDDTLYGRSGNDSLFGNRGNDWIDGGDGNDRIVGGNGDDTLTGGDSYDTLTGSAGADTFVYNVGDKFDIVTDYEVGYDKIDLTSFGWTGSWAQFMREHVVSSGYADQNTRIELGGGDKLVLKNVDRADLTVDDFLL